MKKHLRLIYLFTLLCLSVNGQTYKDNYLNDNTENVAKNYTDSIGKQLTLLYGKTHETYVSNLKNRYFPYLQSKDYIFVYSTYYDPSKQENTLENMGYGTGKLLYDGILYTNQTMRLDLFRNELIILSPDKTYNIVLDPEKVEWFNLFGYKGAYRKEDNYKNFPGEGYYIQLHEGENNLLKKDSYYLSKQSGQVYMNRNVKYYLLKDKVYHQIKNKKSLLKVLHSHKKELEQYIKENRINFDKNNLENAIISIVNHYEKL